MTNLSDTLAALSEAAEREAADIAHYSGGPTHNTAMAKFLVALETAYRTGQLVPVPSVEVEDWHSRAERLHDDKIVTHQMIQDRMQEEIDDLRAVIAAMQEGRTDG